MTLRVCSALGSAVDLEPFGNNCLSIKSRSFRSTDRSTDHLTAILDNGDEVDAIDRHRALWVANDAEGLGQVVLGDLLCPGAMADGTRLQTPRINTAGIESRAGALSSQFTSTLVPSCDSTATKYGARNLARPDSRCVSGLGGHDSASQGVPSLNNRLVDTPPPFRRAHDNPILHACRSAIVKHSHEDRSTENNREPESLRYPDPVMKKRRKNAAAVALAKLRAKSMTPEQRQESARTAGKVGGKARAASLTSEKRKAIAKAAATARWKQAGKK